MVLSANKDAFFLANSTFFQMAGGVCGHSQWCKFLWWGKKNTYDLLSCPLRGLGHFGPHCSYYWATIGEANVRYLFHKIKLKFKRLHPSKSVRHFWLLLLKCYLNTCHHWPNTFQQPFDRIPSKLLIHKWNRAYRWGLMQYHIHWYYSCFCAQKQTFPLENNFKCLIYLNPFAET